MYPFYVILLHTSAALRIIEIILIKMDKVLMQEEPLSSLVTLYLNYTKVVGKQGEVTLLKLTTHLCGYTKDQTGDVWCVRPAFSMQILMLW